MNIEYQLIIGTLLGIFSSLIASAAYFKYSYSLKPELKVSTDISKWKTSEGETKFSIKIVNNSNRKVMNVCIEVYTIKHIEVQSERDIGVDTITESTLVPLKRSTLMELDGLNSKLPNAPYEFRFYTTKVNLEEFMNDNSDSCITAYIKCTDAKTGFGKVFRQDYLTVGKIKDGPFKSGKSLEVERL